MWFRMEIQRALNKLSGICGLKLYVVGDEHRIYDEYIDILVPTSWYVGFVFCFSLLRLFYEHRS